MQLALTVTLSDEQMGKLAHAVAELLAREPPTTATTITTELVREFASPHAEVTFGHMPGLRAVQITAVGPRVTAGEYPPDSE